MFFSLPSNWTCFCICATDFQFNEYALKYAGVMTMFVCVFISINYIECQTEWAECTEWEYFYLLSPQYKHYNEFHIIFIPNKYCIINHHIRDVFCLAVWLGIMLLGIMSTRIIVNCELIGWSMHGITLTCSLYVKLLLSHIEPLA